MVAQELAYGVREDELYAGTPSLSTMKLLLALCASSWTSTLVIGVIDVKSAFLYGEARRRIYIELPPQDELHGQGMVGRLEKAMYGTRDAPLIWRGEVDKNMKEMGFHSSVFQPGVYCHHGRGLKMMVHVDDS